MNTAGQAGVARHRAANLARLLSDGPGAEILAELQKLQLETAHQAATVNAPAEPEPAAVPDDVDAVVGPWRVTPTPDGPELRRRDIDPAEARAWADVDHVPAAGPAPRIVLLGESSARGFLLDPLETPTRALARHLDRDGLAGQVVDLAHTGADVPDLLSVIRQLPPLAPDVVVVYAGNNWVRSRVTPAHLDLLAAALRDSGYPGMRRAYLERIASPASRRVLDALAEVSTSTGAHVVVIVPEFNLEGWEHDAEVELPPLAPHDLLEWARWRGKAEAALDAGDPDAALAGTGHMRALDAGTSPVTGRLRARAALAAGDRDAAATALEQARDAVCGLLFTHTPRITSDLRAELAAGAAERGFETVDLAGLLRADPATPWPDPELFLDYCHLSVEGIDRLAAAVVARIAPVLPTQPPGAAPAPPALSVGDRAIGDLLAAVHASYYGQPRERIRALVERAVRAHSDARSFATALLGLLGALGPVWACPQTPELMRHHHAARYLAPLLSRSAELLGMWDLRAVLAAALELPPGRPEGDGAPRPVDLLATAEQGLLEGAFSGTGLRPDRAYLSTFGTTASFGCYLARGGPASLTLTYRVPEAAAPGDVVIRVNDDAVAWCAPASTWTTVTIAIAAGRLRDGLNRVEVAWPIGGAEQGERCAADAARMTRGEHPLVLGVQGDIFSFDLTPTVDRAPR